MNAAISGLAQAASIQGDPSTKEVKHLCEGVITQLLDRCGVGAINEKIVGKQWKMHMTPAILARIENGHLDQATALVGRSSPGLRL